MSERTKLNIFVREHLPEAEILAQLAEEAAELAQAALKYRRAIDKAKTNPTTTTEADAYVNLIEEAGDVICCLGALGINLNKDRRLWNSSAVKLERWVNRLEAREREKNMEEQQNEI